VRTINQNRKQQEKPKKTKNVCPAGVIFKNEGWTCLRAESLRECEIQKLKKVVDDEVQHYRIYQNITMKISDDQ
jgi:hypothetical protein